MKLKILLMTVILLFAQNLFAQFTVEGRVYDKETGNPLAGANIVLVKTFKGTFSNSEGFFKLRNLKAGEYKLRVSFLGYKEVVKEVVVDSDKKLEIALTHSATMSDEIVVTATRASVREPLTHTDISVEEIKPAYFSQDLPMLLSLTPSVVVTSDAGAGVGYTSMRIRGSDQQRINVTINGVPINDSESHGVFWVNMPDIVSSTDNIQIQRGVGTSTHGTAAFGATLNLQTTSLRDKPYAELSNSFGSFNTLRNTLSFGSGLINDYWSIDGRLSRISSDGYVDRAFSDLSSYYFSGGYYGENLVVKAVTFSGQEQTYLAWTGAPSDSLDTNPTFNPNGLYYDQDGKLRYYDNETDNYKQDHYQLHILSNIYDGINASLSFHYTYGRGYYEQFRQNERLNRYNLDPVEIGDTEISRTDLIRRRWLDNDFYGLTWSFNIDKIENLKIDVGGGYNIYDGDHFGEIIWGRYLDTDIRHRYYDNNALKKDFNIFGKANYEAFDGLFVFGDMQYRKIDYTFMGQAWVLEEVVPLEQTVSYDFFNPKAGISYEITSSQSVYGYYGISHREPVRRDFTESSPDSRPRPERMNNIEIGYKLRSANYMAGVNLYLMDYVDQMVPTGEINDVGGYTRTNIPESFRRGIELEAGYIFNKYINWQANLTLSQNKIKEFKAHYDMYDEDYNWTGTKIIDYENTDIAFSPSVIGSSIIRVTPVKGMELSLSSKYVGKQYIDNTMDADRMLDPYFINDIRLNYTIETSNIRGIELVFAVNNVFDVFYIPNAWIYAGYVETRGLTPLADGYFPQAGRHFSAGLNFKL